MRSECGRRQDRLGGQRTPAPPHRQIGGAAEWTGPEGLTTERKSGTGYETSGGSGLPRSHGAERAGERPTGLRPSEGGVAALWGCTLLHTTRALNTAVSRRGHYHNRRTVPRGGAKGSSAAAVLLSPSAAPMPPKMFCLAPLMWCEEAQASVMKRGPSPITGEATCMPLYAMKRGPSPIEGEALCMLVITEKRGPSSTEGEALHVVMKGGASANALTFSNKVRGRGEASSLSVADETMLIWGGGVKQQGKISSVVLSQETVVLVYRQQVQAARAGFLEDEEQVGQRISLYEAGWLERMPSGARRQLEEGLNSEDWSNNGTGEVGDGDGQDQIGGAGRT
ncbi:hypothetical protein NDU88_003120 [Pleurodeles waltl]|uniref:Uncharacterized protein n=1 Tax=Pleurodeles waltl TaxID=8319 RepID=A0AAV7W4D9_PLEWA|nr:hypothetical protein NDU88_003120 [Pleurodeles waltl]